jgi:hypothetical protein
MAQLDNYSYEGHKLSDEDYLGFWQREEAAIDTQVARSRENYKATGDIVGLNYRSQVADGYAEYIVTKARPLTLMHISLGDGYSIPTPHLRGLNKADIVEFNEREERLSVLFGSR